MNIETADENIQIKKKSNRLNLIIAVIIAIICLSVLAYFVVNKVTSTPHKNQAIANVQNLKNMLKDPDSLKLYEDVLVIFYKTDDHNYDFYTYIDYGAKNSYGAMVRNTAIYVNRKYVCTMEEAIKELEVENKNIELIKASLPYTTYKAQRSWVTSYEYIKKESVMRKLK